MQVQELSEPPNSEIFSSSLSSILDDLERAQPHIILKSATISSLSTINRMTKIRKNRWNNKIVNSIDNLYNKAIREYRKSCEQGTPDFSLLKIAERSMRKQYLQLLWIRINQYGYPINKRIHSEREGELDDFNRILNAGGALLRDFFVIRYPLPTVDEYDYQNQSGENVKPDHPYLTSLDMAEIFRTHLQELAFTLFIRNVPLNKVNKYFLSFFQSCRDLADWIYAGGRAGVNSHNNSSTYIKKPFRFPKYIDKILRNYKNMIVSENFQIGRFITPDKMKQLKNRYQSEGITPDDIINSKKIPDDSKKIVNNFFTIPTIDSFLKERNTLARVYGDKFHKMLLYGLSQPYSLKKVITEGHKYVSNGLPFLIVAEINLTDYISTRRPDLVVFIKINETHWLPIAILDIKSQFEYDCFIRGKRNKNAYDTIKPIINIKPTELSEKNWQYFGYTKLRFNENKQLNEIETLVKQAYYKLYDKKIDLIKGIIRIAPSINKNEWHEYQSEMLKLIISTFTDTNILQNKDQTVFRNKNSDKKISIVLENPPSSLDPQLFDNKTKYSQIYEKPAIGTMTLKNHILYLFAKSSTSAGYSSAWTATYSHLIPYIVRNHRNLKIAIIDLAGIFNKFTHNRLRSPESVELTKALERIQIIQWDLTASLDTLNDELPEGFDVYLFSGWEIYKSMISHQDLELVENEIIRKVPKSAIIYWVDEANRGEFTSKLYHQRTITLDKNYPSLKSKIIFNLPTAPKKPSDKNPQYPDYRIIIECSENNQIRQYWKPTITLRGHTSKFSNRKTKNKLSRFAKVRSDKQLQGLEVYKAYDLIPWLQINLEENNLKNKNTNNLSQELDISDVDLEISKTQSHEFSKTDLKLVNLRFKELDWTSRSKFYVDKSLINSKFAGKAPVDFSFVDLIKTTFPLHRNLLTPAYNIDDLERREKRRLLDTIEMLEITALSKYKTEDIAYLKSLFELIQNSIKANESSKELQKSIIEWEITTNDTLSEIIQDRRKKAYWRHLFHVRSSPKIVKENKEFFMVYGNANYLLLQVLYFIYPELNDEQLCKIWDDLLPFTLEMIGFKPLHNNLIRTQYNSTLLWYHLKRRASYLTKLNLKQILLQRRDGFALQITGGYSWLYIENYEPMLFLNKGNAFSELINKGLFKAIDDEDLVSNKAEIPSGLIPDKISINRYLRKDYIWIFYNNSWQLIGRLVLNTISILNSILSFEIKEIHISPPTPEGDPYEIDFEDVLSKIEFKLPPELYLKFYLGPDIKTGYIDLAYYLKSEVIEVDYDFNRIRPIHSEEYVNSHKMIEDLREYHNTKTLLVGDQIYRFDPIENIEWMGWMKIKALVHSKTYLNNQIVKMDGLEFIKDYKELLDISPEDIEMINFELSHDLDVCVLQEKELSEIRNKVSKLGGQRRYDWKLYNSVKHQGCFPVRIVDNLEGFTLFERNKFKQKYNGTFTGQEVHDLLSPTLQSIKNKEGVISYYLINLEIKNEDIIQEDMLIRILVGNNYQTYLRRRPPGSYRLASDYIVTKIIQSPNGKYLELHYTNIITGIEYSKDILGDENECIRYGNYKKNLEEVQSKWIKNGYMGNLDISEHPDYKKWMQIIQDHRDTCDDEVHDLVNDELIFLTAKRFELIKEVNEEETKFSVILHVERSADTKDAEPLTSDNLRELYLEDLGYELIKILQNSTYKEFLSSINSEFDLIYPQDNQLIRDLFSIFRDLVELVLDQLEEDYGINSVRYKELYEMNENAFLDRTN